MTKISPLLCFGITGIKLNPLCLELLEFLTHQFTSLLFLGLSDPFLTAIVLYITARTNFKKISKAALLWIDLFPHLFSLHWIHLPVDNLEE